LNDNDGSEIEAEKFDRTDRSARAFFKANKPIWKERFQQLDIWITSHEIDVI
jgi:hypothetical protein